MFALLMSYHIKSFIHNAMDAVYYGRSNFGQFCRHWIFCGCFIFWSYIRFLFSSVKVNFHEFQLTFTSLFLLFCHIFFNTKIMNSINRTQWTQQLSCYEVDLLQTTEINKSFYTTGGCYSKHRLSSFLLSLVPCHIIHFVNNLYSNGIESNSHLDRHIFH